MTYNASLPTKTGYGVATCSWEWDNRVEFLSGCWVDLFSKEKEMLVGNDFYRPSTSYSMHLNFKRLFHELLIHCANSPLLCLLFLHCFIPVKLPWIFPGTPLIFNGAPGNIVCNFTCMLFVRKHCNVILDTGRENAHFPDQIGRFLHLQPISHSLGDWPNRDFEVLRGFIFNFVQYIIPNTTDYKPSVWSRPCWYE